MEGGEADLDAERRAQSFEGEAGLSGHGRPDGRFVAAVERRLADERRPGGEFACGLVAADELPNPFRADGIFATQVRKRLTGLKVGQHPPTKVHGQRRRHDEPPKRPSMTTRHKKRKRGFENALMLEYENEKGQRVREKTRFGYDLFERVYWRSIVPGEKNDDRKVKVTLSFMEWFEGDIGMRTRTVPYFQLEK